MRGLMILVAALSLVAGTANAASFDCKAAKSVRERAICADPELSKADDALARAYNDAQSVAPEIYRTELRNQQRAWLRQLDLTCAGRSKDIADIGLRNCLLSDYTERSETLQKSVRKIGAYTVLQYGKIDTVPDPDNQDTDYWRYATLEVLYPQIAGEDALARRFNAWVRQEFKVDAGISDPGMDVWTSVEVTRASPSFVEVSVSNGFYGHGAAHPNHGSANIVWLPATGGRVKASDIFAAPGWQTKLADLVIAEFSRSHEGEKPWGERADLLKMVAEPQRWRITDKSFALLFDPYELASYAAGDIVVELAWKDIEKLLARDSAILAALRR